MAHRLAGAFLGTILVSAAWAQTYTISTAVGAGLPSYVPGKSANLPAGVPRYLTSDSAGDVYFVDQDSVIRLDAVEGNLNIADNHRVLKMTPGGTRSTVVENVEAAGIAVDREGYLCILDSVNYRVLKLAPNGTISTVPVEAAGNLFFAEEYNQLIRNLGHP
jgi:hypothetical protein